MTRRYHIVLVAVIFVSICGFFVPHSALAKKLKSKTYRENFTIKNGTVLEGAGASKTKIKGNVRVRGNGAIRNLEIDGGSVFVLSGASVTIENVVIDDAPGTAIETRGGGTLIVRNSQIIDSEGKAFYIQRGKHVVITGSVIRGAGEEGIDIRSGVSGVISGNTIVDNKESGIEVILGNSSLEITNNTLNNNGSSGIAAQFYTLAKNVGNVTVAKNTMVNNKNFGLDCKVPSGGRPADNYWVQSMTLTDNVISGNRSGTIAPRCGVVRNRDSAAVIAARKKAAEDARKKAEEEARRKAEAERRAREIAQQRRILDEARDNLVDRIAQIKDVQTEIDAQGTVRMFFGGVAQAQREALKQNRSAIVQISDAVQALTQQELDDVERKRAETLLKHLDVIRGPVNAYAAVVEKGGLWRRIGSVFRVH